MNLKHHIDGKIAPSSEQGFTLIELVIVLAVSLIAAGMVVLNIANTVRGIRLRSSGTDYANLLQQARVRAVRDDQYYPVLVCPIAGTASCTNSAIGTASYAYIDIAGTGVYATGDPVATFGQAVIAQPFGSGPALTNLKSQFLPPGNIAQNSVNTAASGPIFGPRGLPCTPVTDAGGHTTCPFLTPTSYITFMQNTQSTKWQAITVTPAGQIRQWQYDGTSSWSPLN